jgi:hypothetical protein
MTDHLAEEDLISIEQRLSSALSVVPPPWLPLRETKDGIGGQSFIRGANPDLDHEIYLTLAVEGEIVRGPDVRLDEVVEYLGHSAEDIRLLIGEVRRLRPES